METNSITEKFSDYDLNNLRDFATQYQAGNTEIFNKLISYVEIDTVTTIKFNDKLLQHFFRTIINQYSSIDKADIEFYVLSALFRDDGKENIFDLVDTSYSPKEVASFVYKKLWGYVANRVEKENKDYREQVVTHVVEDFEHYGSDFAEEEVRSRYDEIPLQEYNQVSENYLAYEQFLNYIGSVESILSNKQNEIYTYLQDENITQQQIAERTGHTQQHISKTVKAINKKISTEYFYWKSVKSFNDKDSTYKKVKRFLEEYENIIQFDLTNQFDYYGYMMNFIEKNYIPEEETKEPAHYDSVIDVLTDRVNAATYEVIQKVVFEKEDSFKVSKRKQEQVRKNILKSLKRYEVEIDKALRNFSGKVGESLSANDEKGKRKNIEGLLKNVQ